VLHQMYSLIQGNVTLFCTELINRFVHCCSTPVSQSTWSWAKVGVAPVNSTCCPNANTTTDGTNKYCCSTNTTWTQNSNCCPTANKIYNDVNGFYYCCSNSVAGGGYTWAANATSPAQSLCCNSSRVTVSTGGSKYCCSNASVSWTNENTCCPSGRNITYGGLSHCCTFAVNSSVTYTYTTGNPASCCDVANTVADSSGVTYCCSSPSNWTTNVNVSICCVTV
jgi:hypothetical protein